MEKQWLDENGKFKPLDTETVAKLNEQEAVAYTVDLMKNEATKTVEETIKNIATKEELEAIKQQLEKMQKANEIAELKANLEGLQKVVKQIKPNTPSGREVKTIEQQIKEQIRDFDLTKVKNLRIKRVNKAVMTLDNIITDNTMRYRIPGLGREPLPEFVMEDFFPKVQITDPNNMGQMAYIDEDTSVIQRNAAATAEDGAAPTSLYALIEKYVTMKSIRDSLDITKAAQRDATLFAQQLRMFLEDNMGLAINQALYDGDGIGVNVTGLYTQVPAFDPLTYNGRKFDDPNISDLAIALKTLIQKGKNNKRNGYNVDFCLLSWNDYLDFAGALKDANGNYIIPPTHGIVFIPTNFVADNTLVIGDRRRFKIYTTLDYDFELGYKSGNFERRIMSLLVEATREGLVRNIDKPAFFKVTDVTAAKAAIAA